MLRQKGVSRMKIRHSMDSSRIRAKVTGESIEDINQTREMPRGDERCRRH